MKFKPWRRRDPFSSSRSLFKVLPSFFLSHQVQTGYCWVGVAQWKCSIGFILFFRQCSLLYMQTASRRVSARAPGSLRPKNGLWGEVRPQQQHHHTKKRAWPFRFSFRIFPRRCLAVAIPFLGRLPIKHQRWCRLWVEHGDGTTATQPQGKATPLHRTNQAPLIQSALL